jgi:hypothetical protein
MSVIEVRGLTKRSTSATPLPFAAARALLAGIAAILAVVAARTTVQRHVS